MEIFKKFVIAFLALFLAISVPGLAFSNAEQEKEQEASQEYQKAIAAWKKRTSPSENHKHLGYFVGDWESSQKVFRESGTEPLIREQEIRVKSLYEGRFTQARIKFKEKIMGMEVEGIVITGYDNYKKKFVSVTFGNLGTNFSFMSGTLDKTGKIRTDYGEADDYSTGAKFKVKAVTTLINQDKYTYEYYQIDPESKKEIKVMEITYSRKK